MAKKRVARKTRSASASKRKRTVPPPQEAPPPAPPEPENLLIQGDRALAAACGVSTRTVYDWRLKGLPYKQDGRGFLYNPEEVQRFRQTLQKNPETAEELREEINRAELRIRRASAEKLERENEIASGNLLPLDEYETTLTEIVTEARAQLQNLPKRFANCLCLGCQTRLKDLTNMIETTLNTLEQRGQDSLPASPRPGGP